MKIKRIFKIVTLFSLIELFTLASALSIVKQEGSILKDLQAECTREGINVKLFFKQPFTGVAYSLGHYETPKCRYISQEDQFMRASATNYSFLIPMNECGTVYHGANGSSLIQGKKETREGEQTNENEVYIENTLLIQNDATIQEARDLAKTLRCVWQKEIHKPLVASLPFGNVKSKLTPKRNTTHVFGSHKVRDVPYRSSYGTSSSSSSSIYNKGRLRFPMKGQVQSLSAYNRRQYLRSLLLGSDEMEGEMSSTEQSDIILPSSEVSSEESDQSDVVVQEEEDEREKLEELKDQHGQLQESISTRPLQRLLLRELHPSSAALVTNNVPSLLNQVKLFSPNSALTLITILSFWLLLT